MAERSPSYSLPRAVTVWREGGADSQEDLCMRQKRQWDSHFIAVAHHPHGSP